MNTKTMFDKTIEAHSLELLKVAVPYINIPEQKTFSIFIKFNELINTIKFFKSSNKNVGICALEENENHLFDMLNDMKSVSTKTEQEFIDQLTNMITMMQLYSTYSQASSSSDGGGGFSFDILKSILPPSQQDIFETYSTMFNSNSDGGNNESE